MLKLVADENFNGTIVRGVQRLLPTIDFVRIQDVGLTSATDPEVLAWAAREKRILFSHDVATLRQFAYERVARGEPMPGVFEAPLSLPVRQAIDDILLIAQCSEAAEWDGQVRFLPLR
jgi:hypothetical protein